MATRLMSMRRFTRGGYREVADPVQLVVRDEIVGHFVPTSASGSLLPSAEAIHSTPAPAAVAGPVGGHPVRSYSKSDQARARR